MWVKRILCLQGLGLFAARAIEKQTMVIEYMGDILRTEVAMRRELMYKAKVKHAQPMKE